MCASVYVNVCVFLSVVTLVPYRNSSTDFSQKVQEVRNDRLSIHGLNRLQFPLSFQPKRSYVLSPSFLFLYSSPPSFSHLYQ